MMARNGTPTDNISVVVMVDGIEKMDRSMLTVFEEIEHHSGTGVGGERGGDFEDWRRKAESEEEEERQVDWTGVLYDEEELEWRRKSKFEKVYEEYMTNVRLLRDIDALNHGKVHY